MSKAEPEKLDYATPQAPMSSDLPAYKRYSPAQLMVRLLLGMMIIAAAFIIVGFPLIRFVWNGAGK